MVSLVERFKAEPVAPNRERFQIPVFVGDETQELKIFMESFFRFNIPHSYYIQLFIIVGVVSIMIGWGIAIILKQIYERKFWILRSQQTSNIKLMIPNSTASFILFEGIFAITWFSYIFWSRSLDEGFLENLKGRAAFMLAAWIPLVLGAWWAAWGSFFLCPGILSRGVKSNSAFDPSRFIPSTLVLNLFSVGFPVIFSAIISFIAAMAEKRWSEAVDMWVRLKTELDMQEPRSVSPQQLALALRIWHVWSHAFWWISLGFLIFCITASTLFLFYSSASLVLIYKLKDQIAATGIIFPGFRSLTKTSQIKTPDWISETNAQIDKEAEAAAALEEERAAMSTFYPPVKNAEAKLNKAKTASERANVLRSALINICIMSLSINVAVLGYVGNTGYITGTIYEASLVSPHSLTKVYINYNLVAGWLAAIFGSVSFSNIFLHTYSTFFENLAETKIRSRTAKSKDEGDKSKELMQMKVTEKCAQPGDTASRNTFGQIKTQEALEEGNGIYNDSVGKFLTNQSDGSNRHLSAQKSFGSMSRYSEGFVQQDFLGESFFAPPAEHAQMESVFEGEGIDSMIGSPELPKVDLKKEDRQARAVSGASTQDLSFDLNHPAGESQQKWDSAKWTRPEVWDPRLDDQSP